MDLWSFGPGHHFDHKSPFSDPSIQSPIFGHLKNKPFSKKSAKFWIKENWTLMPESKNGHHLFRPTCPQNDRINIGFVHLPLLARGVHFASFALCFTF